MAMISTWFERKMPTYVEEYVVPRSMPTGYTSNYLYNTKKLWNDGLSFLAYSKNDQTYTAWIYNIMMYADLPPRKTLLYLSKKYKITYV